VLDLEPNAMSSPASTGGQLLTTITVPSDPSTSNDIPNGVTAHLTVITSDGTSLANYYGGIAYFTDLQGQLWKLNLSKTSLGDLNSVMFGLVNSFRAESSLSNDRLGFNQLASTVVSSSGSYQVIHYFGTGDQTRIQRRASSINNRIYGVSDPNFPAVGLVNQNQTVSSSSFMSINSSSCTFGKSWWGNVYQKANFSPTGYEKIIGRATVYNGNILFTAYQPDTVAACPITGTSRIIEMTSNCGSTTLSGTILGRGLATAPVVDAKGNVYVGVGNLPVGSTLGSGQGNIAKFTSSGAQSSTKVNYRSWREIRN
jgi:Tfp pilus tip-associated adhesin PilY1